MGAEAQETKPRRAPLARVRAARSFLRLLPFGPLLGLGACFGGWARFVPESTPGFGLHHLGPAEHEGGYFAYVPLAPAPAEGWPLILFLHGGGESGTDPRRPTQVGLGLPIAHSEGRFPFVVVFPQCPRRTDWTSRRGEAVALAVRGDALARLPVDPRRVYVLGNSMGGHGALLLAARHPDSFAAVVSVAGRAGRSRWFPTPPDARELSATDSEEALAALLLRMPVWLVHGEEDGITSVDESRRLGEALRAEGAEVRLTVYEDAGHAASWERAWQEPGIFDWLLKHRR